MADARIEKLARVMVNYSLALEPGQKFWLRTTPLAEELNLAIYEEAVKAGAHVFVDQRMPGAEEIFFKYASDEQLDYISPLREIIAETGLGERVTACAGDFHTNPLGSGYDVALLFGVLVSEDEDAGVRLLRTVRESLNPGGYLVVRGLHAGSGDAAAKVVALFDLQLLLSTGRGTARLAADVESWMIAAGFEPLSPLDVALPVPERLLLGRVPRPNEGG